MFPGIHIGPFFIGSYAVCAIIGIFTAFPFAIYHYKKRTGDDISLIFVSLFGGIGVFIGMHLLFGITNIEYWSRFDFTHGIGKLWEQIKAVFGGSVFYGGLIGGLIAGWISIRIQKLPRDLATDCLAPAIAQFHGFARIGCFLGGCCYGVEWEHGITFENSLVESANGVPRVPVQLFESGFEFLLAGLLWFLLLNVPKARGKLLAFYLLIYPVGRFILEFWRGDEYRGFLFGLSTSQLISILMFTASALFLIVSPIIKKRKIAL